MGFHHHALELDRTRASAGRALTSLVAAENPGQTIPGTTTTSLVATLAGRTNAGSLARIAFRHSSHLLPGSRDDECCAVGLTGIEPATPLFDPAKFPHRPLDAVCVRSCLDKVLVPLSYSPSTAKVSPPLQSTSIISFWTNLVNRSQANQPQMPECL